MKLGRLPTLTQIRKTIPDKPDHDEVRFYSGFAVAGALSALPGYWQYQNGDDPILWALVPLACAGATAWALLGEREYLFLPPEAEATPEEDPVPEVNPSQVRKEDLQQTFDDWGIRATIVGNVITKARAMDIVKLQVARGYRIDKEGNYDANFSRDLALPKGARVDVIPNIGNGLAAMYIPKQRTSDVTMSEVYAKLKKPMTFCPGEAAEGDWPIYDAGKMNHIIWAAASGNGKSVSMNATILQLAAITPPHLLSITFIDPKGGMEFGDYKDLPHREGEIETTPEGINTRLKSIWAEVQKRQAIMAPGGHRTVEEYNEAHPNAPLPYRVICVDEMVDLMMHPTLGKSNEVLFAMLLAKSRATGFRFWMGTQRLAADTIPPLLRDNIGHYFGMWVKHPASSAIITGDASLTTLTPKSGDMIVGLSDNERRRVQGVFIDSSGIRLMIKRIKKLWN